MKDQDIVPLRVVLRNFLNHIENLESQSCPEKSYEAEFQDLKIFSENVKCIKEYCCLEGEKEVNRKKNRYKDILPFNISRVVLNEYAGIPGSDYINANYIKGASGSLAYIASQGPLPSTVNDFWRMVVQCEVQVIVMACNVEEAGKAKCEKYWVDDGEEKQFGLISVKLLKSSTVCSDFSVRTMRLKYANCESVIEERTVCQLHYVAWPDHGVPSVVHPLLDMVRLVRDTQASETLPVLVHCSAGCGRTGTICAIDYVWGLLRTGKLTNNFSLLSLIRDMRKQRIAMVQTKEQYVLVHQAVRELFKEQLSMIDSHPYENVDPNGKLIIKEEENTYDSIDYTPKNCLEEKRDNKEKDCVPPPLPLKRNNTKFPSKYEKEIENLSAQQRSMKSNIRNMVPVYPVNEKKKVSDKEYYNGFDKLHKRFSENKVKLDANKPIPSKGILSVPQLESAPKCKPNVKRSKSLKVVRNCEKSSLSFYQSSPTESKRRSSLESNFDEHINEDDHSDKLRAKIKIEPVEEQKITVSQLVSKYDILKNQDHRTFVRSLTCLDLRPKIVFSHTNSVVSSLEDSLAKQRVKLLRSNTHINQKVGSYSQPKNRNFSHVDVTGGMKIDSPHNNYSFLTKNKGSYNSFDKIGNSNPKLGPKPLGSGTPSVKHRSSLISSLEKDLLLKCNERVNNPSFQKLEGLRHLKETIKPRSSSTNRADQKKTLSFEEAFENLSADRNLKPNHKSDILPSSSFLKMTHTNLPVEYSESLILSNDESKYVSKTNQLKFLKTSKKLTVNKSAAPLPIMNDFTHGIQGSSKDPFNQSRPFREDFSRTQHINSGNDEFLPISSRLKEDYPNISDLKSSPSFNDSYIVEESNNIEPSTSSWMERDNSRMQSNYGKPLYNSSYIKNRSKGQTLLVNTSDDSKEVQRRLDGDVVLLDNYEPLNSVNNTGFHDSTHKECSPLQHSDVNYHLQNRKNIYQFNGTVHNSRHPVVSNIGSDISTTIITRTSSKNKNLPRIIHLPSGSQDVTYYSPEIHRNRRDSFHSAPGVDLDRVAASITKIDENLMKATLEELQVRKTKLLMTPKKRYPPKESEPDNVLFGGDDFSDDPNFSTADESTDSEEYILEKIARNESDTSKKNPGQLHQSIAVGQSGQIKLEILLGGRDPCPQRKFYRHRPAVTFVRSSPLRRTPVIKFVRYGAQRVKLYFLEFAPSCRGV